MPDLMPTTPLTSYLPQRPEGKTKNRQHSEIDERGETLDPEVTLMINPNRSQHAASGKVRKLK